MGKPDPKSQQQWAQVIAKAGSDDVFRKRLLSDPAAALKEMGIAIPPGKQLKVVENTDHLVHIVLPAKGRELSDDELEAVAGGAGKTFKEL